MRLTRQDDIYVLEILNAVVEDVPSGDGTKRPGEVETANRYIYDRKTPMDLQRFEAGPQIRRFGPWIAMGPTKTGQGDSEVLLVGGDDVYYRVNDTLYKVKIGTTAIENPIKMTTSADVQLAHGRSSALQPSERSCTGGNHKGLEIQKQAWISISRLCRHRWAAEKIFQALTRWFS